MQLLGRSLDLNQLLGQRMVGHIKKSIDTAIARFEGSQFTHILVRGHAHAPPPPPAGRCAHRAARAADACAVSRVWGVSVSRNCKRFWT